MQNGHNTDMASRGRKPAAGNGKSDPKGTQQGPERTTQSPDKKRKPGSTSTPSRAAQPPPIVPHAAVPPGPVAVAQLDLETPTSSAALSTIEAPSLMPPGGHGSGNGQPSGKPTVELKPTSLPPPDDRESTPHTIAHLTKTPQL